MSLDLFVVVLWLYLKVDTFLLLESDVGTRSETGCIFIRFAWAVEMQYSRLKDQA